MDVSYVTVFNWAKKFGGVFERTHGGWRPYTRIWHVKSEITSVNGKERYFSVVRDSNRNVLSIRISKRQVGNIRILEDASALVGFKPETIMGAEANNLITRKGDIKA